LRLDIPISPNRPEPNSQTALGIGTKFSETLYWPAKLSLKIPSFSPKKRYTDGSVGTARVLDMPTKKGESIGVIEFGVELQVPIIE
jgi:hypothetical protein